MHPNVVVFEKHEHMGLFTKMQPLTVSSSQLLAAQLIAEYFSINMDPEAEVLCS